MTATLTVVPAAAPAAATPAAPASRTALSEHLGRMAAARNRVAELGARWEQLRAHVDRAAAARVELASAKEASAAVMRSWARQPHDGLPFIDTSDIEQRELEVAHYEREAEVSRSAQALLGEHKTNAVRELTYLEGMVPDLLNAILMEDAANIREQLDATITTANALSARLFGLRSMFNDGGAHKLAQDVPATFEMWPEQRAIMAAQTTWQAYVARLAANPSATMEG